ncbi:hypothetical protein Tco_0640507, partial [Tanacetum coccineum]
AMDKEVADKVKDHKRKNDSDDDEDDDDDEGPSDGRSLTQEMLDEGNDSDMEDTDNAHIPKVSTTMWFKPIPESERLATPEPEWTIPSNDFPEPENNWANTYATTYKVPEENKLQRKTYDIGSFIKWFYRRTEKKKLCKTDLEGPDFNLVKAFHKNSVFLQYQMDECHKLLTNKVDLSNPEGHQILRNIYEPLPLGGPPGQRSLLHDNIVPKPDLALELGKSISLTEAEEEAVAREVHATHARIVPESEPEPTQRRQFGIAFRDSFIVLGVPDESTVVSRASSEGNGSKPGVPDEEKLILE